MIRPTVAPPRSGCSCTRVTSCFRNPPCARTRPCHQPSTTRFTLGYQGSARPRAFVKPWPTRVACVSRSSPPTIPFESSTIGAIFCRACASIATAILPCSRCPATKPRDRRQELADLLHEFGARGVYLKQRARADLRREAHAELAPKEPAAGRGRSNAAAGARRRGTLRRHARRRLVLRASSSISATTARAWPRSAADARC